MPSRRNIKKMPSLTVDTSPSTSQSQSQAPSHSPSQPNQRSTSRSASPVRPPYSPLTPTLSASRLATSDNAPASTTPPRQTYTHSQPAQVGIPQPPPVPILFEENPDAIALKAAISILQIQARNATNDIKTLQRVKEQALQDPEGFSNALAKGDIKTRGDGLFKPNPITDDNEDEDEDDEEGESGGENMRMDLDKEAEGKKNWTSIPAPQNVVRCPPINWTQYAIVGESLNKLHKDQQARPSEGMPQRVGPDGQLLFGGEGQRRAADIGVAAPYQPSKDRIEKSGSKKGGKR
ncbi:hypothetical protein G7Y89_g13517 [Cudoniella acicularis]|uniref:Uncharacterized protein n=1 Tax=Cudoniella acicularis TaxID=354080 RepID=A0A8H4R736_9HELO|nr:hypothetical protein G7Y89_g13517 [Cudoniella acicularis]